ncbi:MAG: hypothetical protein H7Y12_01750 [Sphingobacteriaceae bacterium]|nr:hypothetical protein [Cytophagaceae bacterium]
MTTPELKAAFHDWIERLDDEAYLQELYDTLIADVPSGQRDKVELMSRLENSLAKAQHAQGTPHEVVMKKAQQWLSR